MRAKKTATLSQNGFTILELMVATVVLSVVLLIATMTILGVGKLYYKGQNATHTNDTARNILEDVSQHIEFSALSPNLFASPAITGCPTYQLPSGPTVSFWCNSVGSVKVYAYCTDTTRYSFVVGEQFKDGTNHVLWEDTVPSADTANCLPLNVLSLDANGIPKKFSNNQPTGSNGKELLLSGMRLTGFKITQNPSTGAYDITMGVAYGDDDLLTARVVPTPDPSPTIAKHSCSGVPGYCEGLLCRSAIGDQYCATAELTTSVMRRLE